MLEISMATLTAVDNFDSLTFFCFVYSFRNIQWNIREKTSKMSENDIEVLKNQLSIARNEIKNLRYGPYQLIQ